MKHCKIFLAFGLGCLFASVVGRLAVHVRAQDEGGPVHVCVAQDGVLRVVPYAAGCPQGQRSLLLKKADSTVDLGKPKEKKKDEDTSSLDKTILEDLNRRLIKLEGMDCAALGKSRVVAPFEVVDRAGKRIFSVENRLVAIYNPSGKKVAAIDALEQGGNIYVYSAATNLKAALGAGARSVGLSVYEGDKMRVDLGNDPTRGNYRLKFFANDGKAMAGIGQTEGGPGLAFVADTGGNIRAKMRMGGEQASSVKGLFEINNGNTSVAELTEGESRGGRLAIFNTGGENMVVAGVAEGGFGVVRAGPESFKPGYGTLGLPGSFIMGKKQ
jgi:hypothetical protein